MNIKILKTRFIDKGITIKQDITYEVDEEQPIVADSYKIKVPMKRTGKFKYALIGDDEGKLLDE